MALDQLLVFRQLSAKVNKALLGLSTVTNPRLLIMNILFYLGTDNMITLLLLNLVRDINHQILKWLSKPRNGFRLGIQEQ